MKPHNIEWFADMYTEYIRAYRYKELSSKERSADKGWNRDEILVHEIGSINPNFYFIIEAGNTKEVYNQDLRFVNIDNLLEEKYEI